MFLLTRDWITASSELTTITIAPSTTAIAEP
jgi:hypothetical protein